MEKSNVELKEWAPVIIPTLCRYDHFVKCFESLEKCYGAENTIVYVGLDFPANKEHEDGYARIDSFLSEKSNNNGFKKLIIIKRNHNLGLGKCGNASQLQDQVLREFDKLIFTEDDNVFSPCFLEFINKGLELFKDDYSVLAINGYTHGYPISYDSNTFFRQNVDFSAWGYGIWKDRCEKLELLNNTYFINSLSAINIRKVHKNGYNRLLTYLQLCLGKNVSLEDNTYSIYAAINDMDVVMPVLSLVRNIGWDGTGAHSSKYMMSDYYSKQSISIKKRYFYIENG